MNELVVCAWCEREFSRTGKRGPVPTYCSHSCRQRMYEKRHGGKMVHDEWIATIDYEGAWKEFTERSRPRLSPFNRSEQFDLLVDCIHIATGQEKPIRQEKE